MEIALMNRFVASCAETRESLSDYVDDELQFSLDIQAEAR